MNTTATFITANEGEHFSAMGIDFTIKQHAEASNGQLSIVEQKVQPGAGSPMHFSAKEDKVIYVLNGQFSISIGGNTVQATKGDMAIIPRSINHNFKNTGTESGHVLVIFTPGGMENFLKDLSSTVNTHGKNIEMIKQTATRHEVTIV